MIAALYVAAEGSYFSMPDVDPWDEARDARTYGGPYPVVAHPPCARWCQLASVVEKRYGYQVGDDGGLFARALSQVRRWGGVLEHPAYSIAWKTFGIAKPPRSGGWVPAGDGLGFTCHVEQGRYGHKARKATWLYVVGSRSLPALLWGRASSRAWVSWGDYDKYPNVPRLSKKDAKATPPAFRDMLISIAEGCRP